MEWGTIVGIEDKLQVQSLTYEGFYTDDYTKTFHNVVTCLFSGSPWQKYSMMISLLGGILFLSRMYTIILPYGEKQKNGTFTLIGTKLILEVIEGWKCLISNPKNINKVPERVTQDRVKSLGQWKSRRDRISGYKLNTNGKTRRSTRDSLGIVYRPSQARSSTCGVNTGV